MKTKYGTLAFVAAMLALVSVLALPVLTGEPPAYASPPAESYGRMKGTPSEVITGATIADSLVFTTAISGRARPTNLATTAIVAVDLSGAAADTVLVYCALYSEDGTFVGVTNSTATAGAGTDAAGDSICGLLFFDLAGAVTYEIRHAAPSAGNADLRWWVVGPRTGQ